MSEYTQEGYTWTRDFCRWWFHLNLPKHCEMEGDYYVLPKYWTRSNVGPCKLTLRRIYLELYDWNKKKILDLGFLLFDHPELMYKPNITVEAQIDWMELKPFIEKYKVSLANIGLYGIEGAIQNPFLPPLSLFIQHVLNTAVVTDNPEVEDIVNVEWDNYDRYLDPRTGVELDKFLTDPFEQLGLHPLLIHNRLAQVEAITEQGKQWLVTRYVEKEHTKTEQEIIR